MVDLNVEECRCPQCGSDEVATAHLAATNLPSRHAPGPHDFGIFTCAACGHCYGVLAPEGRRHGRTMPH